MSPSQESLLASNEDIFRIQTKAPGPAGKLPLTEDMLLNQPSGHVFGLTQNAGMGWDPAEVGRSSWHLLESTGGAVRTA